MKKKYIADEKEPEMVNFLDMMNERATLIFQNMWEVYEKMPEQERKKSCDKMAESIISKSFNLSKVSKKTLNIRRYDSISNEPERLSEKTSKEDAIV